MIYDLSVVGSESPKKQSLRSPPLAVQQLIKCHPRSSTDIRIVKTGDSETTITLMTGQHQYCAQRDRA